MDSYRVLMHPADSAAAAGAVVVGGGSGVVFAAAAAVVVFAFVGFVSVADKCEEDNR